MPAEGEHRQPSSWHPDLSNYLAEQSAKEVPNFKRLNSTMGIENVELIIKQKEKLKDALHALEKIKPASKEETAQILNDISALCDYMNIVDSYPGHYCPYYFDRTTCWRPVEAGSSALQTCPVYIDGFSNSVAIVSIVCRNDSTWNFHPTNVDEFLGVYGPCIKPRDPSTTQSASASYLTSVLRIAQFSGVVGYCISLISLLVAAVIFLRFKRLHCARNVVHLHLFFAFIMRSFMCVLQYSLFRNGKTTSFDGELLLDENGREQFADGATHWGCKLIISTWNYSLVASYFWQLMEGLYLHNFVYIVFRDTPLIVYIILGWGAPLLIILPWVLVKLHNENYLCWIQYQNLDNFWILRGPIMVIIIVNFCLCINICRELFMKLRESHLKDLERYKKLAKSTCLVIIVLGGYYFIMSIPVLTMDNTVLTESLLSCLSVEHVLSSLQGLLVAIIYCFCNHEVRAEIKRCWQRRLLLKNIPKPTEACNHHIVTSRQKNASISQSIKSQKDASIAQPSDDVSVNLPGRTDHSKWKTLWRKGVSKIAINKLHAPKWEQYDRRLYVHPGTCTTGTALSTVCNSVYSTVTAQNVQRFLGRSTLLCLYYLCYHGIELVSIEVNSFVSKHG
ncbi:G protein coupled receptor, orphan [Trichuris trichiura]|uniref:G protein coupled receptor, orphan n=1 Tax=Trichuris trichiura TaxID=36087 RepID=A0A077ZAG0_TRITR|nr:G protein coupled receptor, orphan [Trichuris trichiura]